MGNNILLLRVNTTMAKTKQAAPKQQSKATAAKIEQRYKEALLTEGKTPNSVYAFCQSMGISEDDFYRHFGSLEAIEKSIWKSFITTVRKRLSSDSAYAAFSAREKVLSFYFALVELLRHDRSFVLAQLKEWRHPALPPGFLKVVHAAFEEWAVEVIAEGKNSGEIAKRPFIDERYQHLLWLHFLFLLEFWRRDDSAGFEQTDVAIEKS